MLVVVAVVTGGGGWSRAREDTNLDGSGSRHRHHLMLTSTKNLDLCLLLKYGGRGREVGSISEAQRLLVLLIWQIFLRSGTVYQSVSASVSEVYQWVGECICISFTQCICI